MHECDIRNIPLSQLELSPDNVRKTPADASAFAELKASIAAHGLLENLIVRAMGYPARIPGPGPGQAPARTLRRDRRRTAACRDAGAGQPRARWTRTILVPCRLLSRHRRAPMRSRWPKTLFAPPCTRPIRWKRSAAWPMPAALQLPWRLASGSRSAPWRKRLRLGNAHAPMLLEAYREGGIDLETLMAFAVTTDHARQVAVWEQVKDQGYRPGAWQIKRMLTERPDPGHIRHRPSHRHGGLRGGGRQDRPRPVRRGRRTGDMARRSRPVEHARHGQAPGGGERTGDALEMGRGASRCGLERHS